MGCLLLTGTPRAFANDEGTGAYIDGNDDPTATAGDRDNDAKRPSRGGPVCEWNVVIGDDWKVAVYDEAGRRIYSQTGKWLVKTCRGDEVDGGSEGFLVPQGGPANPQQLAADARKSLPIAAPAINTSPVASRRLYVKVPTWLWLDDGWWQGYSATATAGRVSSTVSARPVRARWSTGDGGSVACNGPGVVWREGMDEDGTYCKHTYMHSSAGQRNDRYTLTASVEFEITWTSNVGTGGALATITRSASLPVEVGEIQAIESG